MSAVAGAEVMSGADDAEESARRTSYIELFFDLVFVFAITEVATLIVDADGGFLRAALILGLIWWAWGTYAWLTNAIDVELVPVRLAVLVATGASFFMAISVPTAFGVGGIAFAVTYVAVRALMIALYGLGSRDDPERRSAFAKLAPWFMVGPMLVLVGGFLDDPWRTVFWAASLVVDVTGTFFAGSAGFRVSPAHFAERYGLFIIIALGESIVAIGITAADEVVESLLVLAVALAVVGAMSFWWAYFDIAARGMERALRRAHGMARMELARDMFSILHYPLVLGIILYAVAAKKTVAAPDEALTQTGLVALGGAMVAFLVGSAAVRWRAIHVIARERLVAALAIPVVLVLVRDVPAIAQLAVAVGIVILCLAVETVTTRAIRAVARTD